MRDRVYSKTEAGQREIQTREMRLAPRLRSLLVQVDGKRSVEGLLQMLGTAGISEEHFTQLAEAGLISAPVSVSPIAPVPVPSVASPSNAGGSLAVQAERQMALYSTCNEAISRHLGLKGFKLQLQLEKLAGVEDYRRFGEILVEAVHKARGEDEAEALRGRLGSLLSSG